MLSSKQRIKFSDHQILHAAFGEENIFSLIKGNLQNLQSCYELVAELEVEQTQDIKEYEANHIELYRMSCTLNKKKIICSESNSYIEIHSLLSELMENPSYRDMLLKSCRINPYFSVCRDFLV